MTQFNRRIESYVYHGKVGVLVELEISNPEASGFESFGRLAKDLAMQIAVMSPTCIEELLGQPSVANSEITVEALIAQCAAELQAKISVVRFVRWEVFDPRERPEPPRTPAVIHDLRAAG